MKRLIFVLGGLLALPAFAEVAPFYYDGITEYADGEIVDNGVVADDEIVVEQSANVPVAPAGTSARVNTPIRSASRVTSAGSTSGNRVSNSRVVAARSGTARNTSGVVSPRVATTGANVARAGSTTQTVQLSTSGKTYVPSNTGRVGVRAAGSVARAPSVGSVSVSNTTTTTAESVKEATENLDSLMELTDYCKAQYAACMDNFCNVLDDNQGRCSCSKNVKNYEKTEEALRTATEELQEVAQRIQYIGLTADEITTLFTQTEAEAAMQTTSDSTKLKNDLDRIKNMIVGVKGGSASAIGDSSGISLDLSNLLSFNIDSTGFDLSALFGTTSQNTASAVNQRGEALYKTASARCKSAVLNQCTAQGVDAGVIVNSYDVEIDKQCIAYERALTDSNTQMAATVRNAKTVLQKARLMVAQQKNQYDLRGCISALDSCMQDDYVCGTDYESCLDPTGKYIVDGKVVAGSMPGIPGGELTGASAADGLYTVWNKGGSGSNIWSNAANYSMATFISDTMNLTAAKTSNAKDISEYLQTKIGYHDDTTGRNYGMCISILNKCQDYTYDNKGKYMANNSVIASYLERAFRQIKTAQDEVLSNYASSCLSDVTSCLSQNNYSFSASASINPSDMAIKACLPVITTCRSVTLGEEGNTPLTTTSFSDVYKWLDAGISTTYESACLTSGGSEWSGTSGCSCTGTGLTQSADKRTCVCSDSSKTWDGTECK